MIPASTAFLDEEARNIGATPVFLFSLLPYLHPNGVDSLGSFTHCAFVGPDKVLFDYFGFTEGLWQSAPITSPVKRWPTTAVISWDWNAPGFTMTVSWRSSDSLAALATTPWQSVANGGTITVAPFYQFQVTTEGYRAWACDLGDPDDGFLAYAEDAPGELDEFQGYAADTNHRDDVATYFRALQILGEYPIANSDVEQAGNLTIEAPKSFGEMISGHQSGLLLNNREGLWSTRRDTFIFAQEMANYATPGDFWRQTAKRLKLELAYQTPTGLTDSTPLFLGKVIKIGPVQSSIDSPHVAEIYVLDWIDELLKRPIALPDAKGEPQPLTMGEFLCKADAVSGWSPATVSRSAYFEAGNFEELDHLVTTGGGASLLSPGLIGAHGIRFQTTGANQSAYGSMSLSATGEMHVEGTIRFHQAPGSMATLNMTFLSLLTAAGVPAFSLRVDDQGNVFEYYSGGQSSFNINAYLDVIMPFAVWCCPTGLKVWFNVDEVLNWKGTLPAMQTVLFGAMTASTAENWTIDFDDLEIRPKYYDNAFRVTGSPFAGIGAVYADKIAQPDSKTVGAFTQTLTRFPQWGMVQFASTDPSFSPSSEILIRVIQDPGGIHAVDAITRVLATAGLDGYINTASFAAAKAAVPGDIVHCRFENPQGVADKTRNRDFSQTPLMASDALKSVCSVCLYFIYVEADGIKLFPYLGTAPGSPVLSLTDSNSSKAEQITDLDNLKYYVSVIFGWHDRDPGLSCLAGTPEAGQGDQIDLTWNQPVATESRPMAQSKANLLLQFETGEERWEPITTSLKGARLQLFDPLEIADPNLLDAAMVSRVQKKDLTLDFGGNSLEHTSLQLINYLGEI